MTRKKNNLTDKVSDKKNKASFLSGITTKKLITEPQDSVLCEIATVFDDQFHYVLKTNNENLEIFYSPSIKKVTGYTPTELIKLPSLGREMLYEEDAEDVKKKLFKLESGRISHLELLYRYNKKDGKIIWLKEQIKMELVDNQIIQKGLVIDVTEFKKTESDYGEIINKLSNEITARDNFLSILSHDLRAPFSSILGFTEILLSEATLTDAERTEYLNYINDSSTNQLQLVNYLLDWSNLQTGRMNMVPHRVQAQGLVFNCISALTGIAMRKNIDIKVNVPDSIFIEADERLLLQVITNLVSNAIKFSDDGKTIKISADRFNNELVEFVITDEGVGIPENYQQRIFKFEKMFSTRGTRGEKGTGLGLSLVKEIIERHNGQIWFYSKEKIGSEFHFTIPSSENTILLVENNRKDFLQIEKIIKENFPQFKFVGTDNGFEAINVVLKQHPSLIISSHDLPLMNGIQFVKSIIKGDKKYYAPIIALVDSTDATLIKNYQEIGIKSILLKPVNIRQFNKEISIALN
ncbi:MAG TPA: ATP-binding protein [Ignavibacteriaceae bacterium]|nr:ATP-binding protein [Ignavibacteriaceae bacterium]HRN25987.1 ATP-binding protein [Ignavibacteriaceae bacterium]HRP91369.1 ATP-binding protein [Ignavibacteriaceae bacterium]HRQ53607.1 ATP-binding protein [Ignavibacteriaceae bacterium]